VNRHNCLRSSLRRRVQEGTLFPVLVVYASSEMVMMPQNIFPNSCWSHCISCVGSLNLDRPCDSDVSLQVSGRRECLGTLWEAHTDSQLSYRRYAVVHETCCQVRGLREEVSRLQSIQEDEQEIDRVFMETIQPQESQPCTRLCAI